MQLLYLRILGKYRTGVTSNIAVIIFSKAKAFIYFVSINLNIRQKSHLSLHMNVSRTFYNQPVIGDMTVCYMI